jgi:hypothetical protein
MLQWQALRAQVGRFGSALRGFLHGFVGQTELPKESGAACRELTHRANGRGRCC